MRITVFDQKKIRTEMTKELIMDLSIFIVEDEIRFSWTLERTENFGPR